MNSLPLGTAYTIWTAGFGAVGVNNPRAIHGAGAYTCNEPERSFHVSLNQRFRSAPAARIVAGAAREPARTTRIRRNQREPERAVANSSVGTIDALRTAP